MKECFGYKFSDEELKKYFVEQEVLYRDYKSKDKEFQHYAKKDDSYNAERKTIVLYIPKYRLLAEEIARIKRETLDEDEVDDIEYYEDWGCYGYETSINCGRYMMEAATWWVVKATDEELEVRTKQDNTPYGFHRATEDIEADCKIVELVKAFRNSID